MSTVSSAQEVETFASIARMDISMILHKKNVFQKNHALIPIVKTVQMIRMSARDVTVDIGQNLQAQSINVFNVVLKIVMTVLKEKEQVALYVVRDLNFKVLNVDKKDVIQVVSLAIGQIGGLDVLLVMISGHSTHSKKDIQQEYV